jgi:sugar phosphate isomerase/epimerase
MNAPSKARLDGKARDLAGLVGEARAGQRRRPVCPSFLQGFQRIFAPGLCSAFIAGMLRMDGITGRILAASAIALGYHAGRFRLRGQQVFSRRDFLATGAVGALAMASSRFSRAEGKGSHNIGVQLYVLRDLLARDFDGTLAKVAAVGIRNVEFAGFYGRTAQQVRTSLSNAGLSASGAHCLLASMSDDAIGHMIDFCHEVGMPYMIAAVPSIKAAHSAGKAASSNPFEHIELEDWRWSAERFNLIGARVRDAGMRFAYHNHNIETQKYGDIVAFDEVLRLTDPAVVGIEFDIGNFIAGGGDPYPYLEKYPHRFELAHVKEWVTPFAPTITSTFPKYAAFGQGTTDWKKLLDALKKAGVKEIFIEQDGTATGDELGAVRQAYQFLRKVQVRS